MKRRVMATATSAVGDEAEALSALHALLCARDGEAAVGTVEEAMAVIKRGEEQEQEQEQADGECGEEGRGTGGDIISDEQRERAREMRVLFSTLQRARGDASAGGEGGSGAGGGRMAAQPRQWLQARPDASVRVGDEFQVDVDALPVPGMWMVERAEDVPVPISAAEQGVAAASASTAMGPAEDPEAGDEELIYIGGPDHATDAEEDRQRTQALMEAAEALA